MVQETFLKLYRNIGSYDPAFRFSTWLYTAAGRLAISSHRRRRIATVSLSAEGAAEPAAPSPPADGPPGRTALWDAARTLAASQFRALWLRFRITSRRISVSGGWLGRDRNQVVYSQIREVRSVPRGFGAWGDMVLVLEDGSRLEMRAVPRFREVEALGTALMGAVGKVVPVLPVPLVAISCHPGGIRRG